MKVVTIIGAGVVGCAVARQLAATGAYEVLVVERNGSVSGENQSSRNSGVVHAGIYYERSREPLKARLCVKGNAMLYEFCNEYGIPCKRCGKLVVASDDMEAGYLAHTLAVAQENGVPGVEMVSAERVREMEPAVQADGGALYVPSSGIIDSTRLVEALAASARENGALFITGSTVTALHEAGGAINATLRNRDNDEVVESDIVINAAGLYADDVARMLNPDAPYRIKPVRGESAQFYRNTHDGVRLNGMNVYPAPYGYYNNSGERAAVPFPEFRQLLNAGKVTKTVGIHLTPTLSGDSSDIGSTVTIGPAKTVDTGKENYGHGLKPSGYYPPRISRYFPGIGTDDCQLFQAGIMAVRADAPDWLIEYDSRHRMMIHLVGIDSPGLTACLALAEYVAGMLDSM